MLNLAKISYLVSIATCCSAMNTMLVQTNSSTTTSKSEHRVEERIPQIINQQGLARNLLEDPEVAHQAAMIVLAQNQLLEAALAGDTAKMQDCISQGALVNRTDASGNTVLLNLLKGMRCSLGALAFLLEHGAYVGIQNSRGDTPLMLAVTHENGAIATLCLAKTDPKITSMRNNKEETALILAARAGKSKELLNELIARGALVNEKDSTGNTALAYLIKASRTASSRSLDVIELLLERGADVGIANQDGATPLMYAIDREYGSEALAKACLLGAKQDAVIKKNKRGRTALMIAIESPWATSIVPLLLNKGAAIMDIPGADLIDFAFAKCPDVVPLLVEKIGGYDVHRGLETALRCGSAPAAEYFFNHGAMNDGLIAAYHRALAAGNNSMITLLTQRGVAALVIEGQRAVQREFGKAASERNSEQMKDTLQRGAQVNWKDEEGNTPLVYALRNTTGSAVPSNDNDDDVVDSSLDGITFLLQSGADVGMQNTAGDTPLMWALRSGDLEVITLCLSRASTETVSMKNNDGETALMLAAKLAQSKGVVAALISKGADIHEQDKLGNTPLVHAIKTRRMDARYSLQDMRILLEHNASVDTQNNDQETPLMYAVSRAYGSEEVALMCLSKASPKFVDIKNKNGTTALMTAAAHSADWTRSIVTRLLELGANPLVRNYDNQNALDIALRHSPDIVPLLLAKAPGYNIDNRLARELSYSNAPAVAVLLKLGANHPLKDAYLKAAVDCDHQMLEVLLDYGVPVDSIDLQGRTALVIVAGTKRMGWLAMDTLLKHRAHALSCNEHGCTALMLSSQLGKISEVYRLLKYMKEYPEAINGRDNTGKTALMYAVEACESTCPTDATPKIMAHILEEGADAGMQDNNGNTALICACQNAPRRENNHQLLGLLLAHASVQQSINVQNSDGQTALMLSAEKCADEEVRMLLEYMKACPEGVNLRDKKGRTALRYAIEACLSGCPIDAAQRTVAHLLEHGADAGVQDEDGDTTLIHACKKVPLSENNHPVVEMLLAHRAIQETINVQNNEGETALLCTLKVFKKRTANREIILDVIKALLKHKASLTIDDNEGNNAFAYAASNCMTGNYCVEGKLAQVFFEHADESLIRGSLIRIIQTTPREHYYNKFDRLISQYGRASHREDPSWLRVTAEGGLHLGDITDAEGKTALAHAVAVRNWGMVESLAWQSSPSTIDKVDEQGKSALLRAVEAHSWYDIETLSERSSQETIDRLEKDPECKTVLFHAVNDSDWSYSPHPIKKLAARLSQGFIEMRDAKGRTALWYAVNSLTSEHVEALAPRCSREIIADAYEQTLSLEYTEKKKTDKEKILQILSDLGGKQSYEEACKRKHQAKLEKIQMLVLGISCAAIIVGSNVHAWLNRR